MQHVKGLSWHMPYAISYNISYTFLPLTANILALFQTVSSRYIRCGRTEQMATCCRVGKRTLSQIFSRHYLNLRTRREICRIAHWSTLATLHSHVNIAHHQISLRALHRPPGFASGAAEVLRTVTCSDRIFACD